MPLTPAQLPVLKADIDADPVLSALPLNDDASFQIAAAYNALASPAFRVWRTNVTQEEILNAIIWTEFIAATNTTATAERDTISLLTQLAAINFGRPNIRTGFDDALSGAGRAASRNAVRAVAKRDATRAEKLFATGTGTEGSPAVMTFEGFLSFADVNAARNS